MTLHVIRESCQNLIVKKYHCPYINYTNLESYQLIKIDHNVTSRLFCGVDAMYSLYWGIYSREKFFRYVHTIWVLKISSTWIG